jgi:hypothetical protein
MSASHFRVGGVIAAHDRMSIPRGTGAGCYASHKTIAKKANVNYSNLSTIMADLIKWGYVTRTRSENVKVRFVYRICYESLPNDKLPSLPKDEVDPDTGEVTPVEGEGLPIPSCQLCPADGQVAETVERSLSNIFPKRFSETERNSAEAAPFGVGLGTIGSISNVGAFLAITERELKSGSHLDVWTKVQIEKITDELDTEDPNYNRAVRLLEQYA